MPVVPSEAQDALCDWYTRTARRLPWRETRDPYAILVSEIMLQQTQAERVVPKYEAFLQQFPTVASLAAASPAEVIRAWAGLGYNRRALNLQRTCAAIAERHGGVVPSSVEELQALPGIGPYTAGAVACFAYEQDVAFADVNIRRVIHRVAVGPDVPQRLVSERELETIAQAALPPGCGYVWNQGLMELGATLCKARSAACQSCPVRRWCRATGQIQTLLAGLSRSANGERVPFERTSRFARGRIIEALRVADDPGLTEAELLRWLEAMSPTVDLQQVPAHLQALVREGMVEAVDHPVGVFEESPSYDGTTPRRRVRYRLPVS
ncbi:MAG: A/G-specific adenine glycosylase [Chloroflexi bacterium]|nr:MAG: A/G-specific adenine glycosylase [Chloroflexota bacterium]